MLVLKKISLAAVYDLFRYKSNALELDPFPGYSADQWGIKAHNRPWIVENGDFARDQRAIEVGGAYSTLPKYLSETYELEAWVGDDFGRKEGGQLWSRWGDPELLPQKYPNVKYVFEPFGTFSSDYPDQYFDRIFSVSTLEHIPRSQRCDVFRDMNRCLKPGGIQLHTIDISIPKPKRCIADGILDKFTFLRKILNIRLSEIQSWCRILQESGIHVDLPIPNSLQLLDRSVLVESPDVVYRFYPPNDEPKSYSPGASLLLVIEELP